jgi:hypothetical protein
VSSFSVKLNIRFRILCNTFHVIHTLCVHHVVHAKYTSPDDDDMVSHMNNPRVLKALSGLLYYNPSPILHVSEILVNTGGFDSRFLSRSTPLNRGASKLF